MGGPVPAFTMLTSFVHLMFVVEAYHALAHWLVLVGWKMLPRKDLVSTRYYFLIDCGSAALAFLLHRNEFMFPFFILQQWQHIFYYSTWDRSNAAKRVISWSSLDWDRGRWNQLDLVLGTAFDLSIHIANAYLVGRGLPVFDILVGLVVVALLYFVVFANPKLAWANRTSAPDWVARRIKPLSQDQIQEVEMFDNLLSKK